MQEELLSLLRCPVSGSPLHLETISLQKKYFHGKEETIVSDGILWAQEGWFYPVINGIPRLLVESLLDYDAYFREHIPDFESRKTDLFNSHGKLIREAAQKNKRTKESFAMEWKLYDYQSDRTWDADKTGMLQRFLKETSETESSVQGKLIFDAGCGNGVLDSLLAQKGASVMAMDFSLSIEKAFASNQERNLVFIQGDIQYPPLAPGSFDIVQCSGVLIHTPNPPWSFSRIEPLVKKAGKLSVWLYHPRKNILHNIFNRIRRFSSRLPLGIQYPLYRCTIFPLSYIIKRLKGNKQNPREMMIDILDWFTPEYRWEYTHEEVENWFTASNYREVQVTSDELFGFNTIGTKC